MDAWDEIRTAWHVARAGTVSGAAEALGVHHATVIRHVDALEARLGVKLFQRHGRGYTLTEAGQMLAEAGAEIDARLNRLGAGLSGAEGGISGDLVMTVPPELSALVLPALTALRAEHPRLMVRLRTDRRVLRLEQGEAHLAIRAGERPQEPDNVAQPLGRFGAALYASDTYLQRHGRPARDADLVHHVFIADEATDSRVPCFRWLADLAPEVALRSDDAAAQETAIRAGMGMGFLFADRSGTGLEQVMPTRPEWSGPLWLVSHIDLHRSAKLQAAMGALKQSLGPAAGTAP